MRVGLISRVLPPLQYLQKWLSVDFQTSVILPAGIPKFLSENKSNSSGTNTRIPTNGQMNSSNKTEVEKTLTKLSKVKKQAKHIKHHIGQQKWAFLMTKEQKRQHIFSRSYRRSCMKGWVRHWLRLIRLAGSSM
jgi:hypothetical protein